MKTRNIIAILAALPLIAGLAGCKSDDQPEAKPAREILMVLGGDVIQYRADETGPSTDVSIKADCRWTVELNPGNFGDELSVSPRQGNGNGTLIISSDQNATPGLLREATITLVSDGGLRQKVTVRQTGGDDALNLSNTAFHFAANAVEGQLLTITSNTSWQIQVPSGVDWVHFSRTNSSDGEGPVEITVDGAVTDAVRTAAVAVTYGSGKSVQLEVSQDGLTSVSLRVPTEDIHWTFEPSEGGILVESNAEWHAYIPSSVNWLHFDSSQADESHHLTSAGNGEFRIYADENTTGRARLTAVVIIAGTKNPQQAVVLVEQYAAEREPDYSLTVGDLTSLSVSNTSAEFHFSFASTDEVGDYGLVFSDTEQLPTRDNAQVAITGQGGKFGSVLAPLANLQESTTYHVRAFVQGQKGIVYSPNVVTITTSSSVRLPGESDNPDPILARKHE